MALELIHLSEDGEWVTAQVAVNGCLAVPFSFHKSTRDGWKDERQFFDYLEAQGKAMFDMYGDARQWPENGRVEVERGVQA